MNGHIYPLEIKLAVSPNNRDVKKYELLSKASLPRGMGGIICMHQGLAYVDRENLIIPAYLF
jgi:hypothetical protein